MLIALQRRPVPLRGDVDPTMQQLVNLIPDYSSGQRLHSLYVNNVMAQLPGNYSQMFGTGPAFRSVFYPNWRADPLAGFVPDTGLDGGWWNRFAIAVLCQAIADMGSNIRGQMLSDKINADVRSMNATLRSRSARVYARVFAATFAPATQLLAKFPDKAAARKQFHDALLDNVLNHQLWYQAGAWDNPDWELFNSYAKYIALGASDTEVDNLITDLQNAGLPIPSVVGVAGWRSYANELRDKPDVDLNDIRDACAGPVTATTYLGQSRLPNGNCYEFTANTQPGTIYRQVPGGCCFTKTTQVLNGDGQPVLMSSLRPGDTISTRNGTATVGYVATPLRGDRLLYRPAGGGAVFTATHPVVNAQAGPTQPLQPAVLAFDPAALIDAQPPFADDGVGSLAAGSCLYQRAPGPRSPVSEVTLAGIESVPPSPDDEYLVDVNLTPTDGSRQEYWVGDGTTFHLACPEFPVLNSAGPAAFTVLALMEGLIKSNGPDGTGWPDNTVQLVQTFGAGIFGDALNQALATTPSFGAPPPVGSVVERVDRIYAALGEPSPATSAIIAALFDGILAATGQWLSSLVAMGWRTSTLLGGGMLTITVFDLVFWPGALTRYDADLRIDVTFSGSRSSESTSLWPHAAASDTAFHRRVGRIAHVDPTDDPPSFVSFAILTDGESLPRACADAPLGDGEHRLRSALLRNASGVPAGAIRFDLRQVSHEAAAAEISSSGLWTDEASSSYAQALGTAMVSPVLAGIRAASASRAPGSPPLATYPTTG